MKKAKMEFNFKFKEGDLVRVKKEYDPLKELYPINIPFDIIPQKYLVLGKFKWYNNHTWRILSNKFVEYKHLRGGKPLIECERIDNPKIKSIYFEGFLEYDISELRDKKLEKIIN